MTQSAPLFNRLALIGTGLIGSSIARAARAQNAVREIVATAQSAATRRRVAELGFADQVVESNAAAVAGADLVIVCVPVGACGEVAAEIAPHLSRRRDRFRCRLGQGRHRARDGPASARRRAFRARASGRRHRKFRSGCRLCRHCSSAAGASSRRPKAPIAAAVEKLAAFWSVLGANVETMPAAHHDLVLAITSHLPHLIAYTIVGTADELAEVTRSEVLKFSAGGFRDFTRIAASDPTMWRDVFLANKDAVLEMLGTFSEDLSQLTRAIRRGDGEALFEHFTRTRAIRRGIVADRSGLARPPISAASHPDLPVEPLPRPYAVSSETNDSARSHRQRFVHRTAQRRDCKRLGDHVMDDAR